MQNVAKKTDSTVATALLFVSLLMVPLSLKAIGFTPSLSAGVAAWRHVAGIFADSYQPMSAMEMLAVNFTDEGATRDEAEPLTVGLLASTQPFDVQFDEPLNDAPAASAEARTAEISVVAAPVARRCAKSTRPAPHATPATPVATNIAIPVEDVRAQALEAAESAKALVPIRREAVRRFEREMAHYRVTFGEAMSFAHKEFKFMVKVKPTVSPVVTSCAFSKPLSPEQVKRLRAAWTFKTESVIESAEKSELE